MDLSALCSSNGQHMTHSTAEFPSRWIVYPVRRRESPRGGLSTSPVSQAADVGQALGQGCEAVQFATAAMLNPGLGLAIRREGF